MKNTRREPCDVFNNHDPLLNHDPLKELFPLTLHHLIAWLWSVLTLKHSANTFVSLSSICV